MKTWMQRPLNRAFAIALLVVALIWGLWQLGTPPSYRLFARIPYTGADTRCYASTTQNGFLLKEGTAAYVLRDWHGKVRWQVNAAAPRLAVWPFPPTSDLYTRKDAFLQNIAESPNGQYLAVATLQESGLRVQLWQEGRLTGEHLLPIDLHQFRNERQQLPSRPPISLSVLDNGQTFLTLNTRGEGRLYAMSGSSLQAQGAVPKNSTLAPDAAALVVAQDRTFTYYSVAVQHGAVVINRRYIAPMRLFTAPIYANGIVLAHIPGKGKFKVNLSGGLYDLSGLRQQINADLSSAATPDGRIVLWHDITKHQLDIYDTTKNTNWVLPFATTEDEALYAVAWPTDGNHVAMLQRGEPSHLHGSLRYWLAPLISLSARQNNAQWVLQLYQQPKKLLAQLRLRADASGLYWQGETVQSYCFSPDGHTLLLTCKNGDGKYEFLLFGH